MGIDASAALSDPGVRLAVSAAAEIAPEEIAGEEVAFESVRFEGEVRGSPDSARVEGTLRCEARARCALCLGEASLPIEARIDEVFSRDAKGTDAYPLDGDVIEPVEMFREALILALPMRFLCKDDCLGLCPKCGSNRNEGECACPRGDEPD